MSATPPEAPRLPGDWSEWVNEQLTKKELERLRLSVARGTPFGSAAWVSRAVKEMGLEHTVRTQGRPRKAAAGEEGGEAVLGGELHRGTNTEALSLAIVTAFNGSMVTWAIQGDGPLGDFMRVQLRALLAPRTRSA